MASSGEGPFAIASAIAACAFDFFLSLPRAFFTLSGIFPIDAAFCLAIFFWKLSICFVTSFAVFFIACSASSGFVLTGFLSGEGAGAFLGTTAGFFGGAGLVFTAACAAVFACKLGCAGALSSMVT